MSIPISHVPTWTRERLLAIFVIEENCWLGIHAVIAGNLTVGRGSVVAANAVVTKDAALCRGRRRPRQNFETIQLQNSRMGNRARRFPPRRFVGTTRGISPTTTFRLRRDATEKLRSHFYRACVGWSRTMFVTINKSNNNFLT